MPSIFWTVKYYSRCKIHISELRAETKKGKSLKCAIHISSSIDPIEKPKIPLESAFRALFKTIEIFSFGLIELEMWIAHFRFFPFLISALRPEYWNVNCTSRSVFVGWKNQGHGWTAFFLLISKLKKVFRKKTFPTEKSSKEIFKSWFWWFLYTYDGQIGKLWLSS